MKSFSRVITRIRHEFLSFPSKIWSDRVDVVVVATRFKALLLGAARGHGTSSSRKTLTSRRRSLSLSLSLRAFSKSKGSPKARRTRPALRHFERWVFPTSIVIRGRKSLPVMRFIGSMSMPWKLAVGELEKIGIKKIQFPTFPNFLLSLSLLYISMYSPKDKRTGYRIARVMVIRKKGIASGNK